VAKAFTITGTSSTGTSGIGTDLIGNSIMGLTNNLPTIVAGELPKRAFIYKSSRIVQVEIRTNVGTANYELLGAKIIGIPQSRGNAPSAWNVS
jgi:hypothetical protein